MLHEQDGGLVLLQHRLDLHSGDDVDVVHRLVPDVQVHGFADGTTAMQAYLAAKAGASYVAPYVNRIDNMGYDGVGVVI